MRKIIKPENDKFALDTNFLVFAADPQSQHYNFCGKILDEAEKGLRKFCIADKTLFEFYAVLENLAVKRNLGTISQAQQSMEMYLTCGYFEILHSTKNTALIVNELIKNKTKIKKAYIHDIALVAILLENEVEYLYTDNIKDFQEFTAIKTLKLE